MLVYWKLQEFRRLFLRLSHKVESFASRQVALSGEPGYSLWIARQSPLPVKTSSRAYLCFLWFKSW